MPDRLERAAERLVAAMPAGPSAAQLRRQREARQRRRFAAVALVAGIMTLNGIWWARRPAPATVPAAAPATTAVAATSTTTGPTSTTSTTTSTTTTSSTSSTSTTIPNRPPIAVTDVVTTLANTAISVSVLANDVDPDGDQLTVSLVGPPTDGTVAVIDGIVTYTPSPDFVGQVTVTYVVVDEAGASATGTLTITVVEA